MGPNRPFALFRDAGAKRDPSIGKSSRREASGAFGFDIVRGEQPHRGPPRVWKGFLRGA
jgi:hypothetical protein